MRQNEAQPGVTPESKGIGIEKPILAATFDPRYDVRQNEAQPGVTPESKGIGIEKPILAATFDPSVDHLCLNHP